MISTANILAMTAEGVIVVLLVAAAFIFIKKKYSTSILATILGAASFFIFAMVIEQIFHSVVMLILGQELFGNTLFTAIYGGLAAGIFEETGRFLVMKFLLKKKYDNPFNALAYGIGHGGCEALLILGSAVISNVALSLLYNSGKLVLMLGSAPEDARNQVLLSLRELERNTNYVQFLMGDAERVSAMMIHIGLSLIVWVAVVKRKTWLYPLAIILHALVDGIMVIVAGTGINLWAVEGVIFAMAVVLMIIGIVIFKTNLKEEIRTFKEQKLQSKSKKETFTEE